MTELEAPGPPSRPAQGWTAATYDAVFAFVPRHGQGVVELLDPQAGERILDLGCGTGRLTAEIASRGAIVSGIDADPEMVAAAREQHPELRFEVGNALDLEVAEPLDAIFSNAVLHWIRDQGRAIERIAAALRPGGRLVAELGARGNVVVIEHAMRQAARAAGLPRREQPVVWYFPTPEAYADLLLEHGLEATHLEAFDRPTPLEGGEAGLREWLRMFARWLLDRVPEEHHEAFLDEVENACRPALYRGDGDEAGWIADYRRLRVVAVKRSSAAPDAPTSGGLESDS